MHSRWAEEITSRAAARWPEQRRKTAFGGKNLLLPVVESAPLLRVLRLLDRHGDMTRDSVRKYMQINHMVALLEPVLGDLIRAYPTVRVLDAACGNSYLTLVLAWCFEHLWHHPCQLLGADRNPGVVGTSTQRAADASLDGSLRFTASAIRSLDVAVAWEDAFGETVGEGDIHAVVALHACDTATDEALALGVGLGADFIGVAPCCQSELSRKWAALAGGETPGPLAPLWASPHLRREAAATLTDTMRTLLLRGCGYRVTAMEFVPSTHTPKNTLLRARRDDGEDRSRARADYQELKAALGGASIRAEALMPTTQAARRDPSGVPGAGPRDPG